MPYSFRRASLQKMARMLDLAIVGFAFVIALVISSGSLTWPDIGKLLVVRIKVVNLLLLIGYFTFCSLVFSFHGFYVSRRERQWKGRIATIILAVMVIVCGLLALRKPLDFSFATNSFLLIFFALCFSLLTFAHEMSRVLQYVARLHGRNFRNVVIVGDGQRALNLAARIEQQPTLGYRLLRIISTKETEV